MRLTEKYIKASEKMKKPDDKRDVVSDDVFALIEALEILANRRPL